MIDIEKAPFLKLDKENQMEKKETERRVEFLVDNQKVIGDLYLPKEDFPKPFPVVILSHGYESRRTAEKYSCSGEKFPLKGTAVLRFDHRGALNGESDGKFEYTTLFSRVEDLKGAIDYLANTKEINPEKIGLLGSSLGGRTILAFPKDERIKAMVLLATPTEMPPQLKLKNRDIESLKKSGYYQYPNGVKINKKLYEEIEYGFEKQAEKVKCPTLILHGRSDELVPPSHANILYKAIKSEIKELKMIESADHAFTDLEKLDKVLDYALDWFKKYL